MRAPFRAIPCAASTRRGPTRGTPRPAARIPARAPCAGLLLGLLLCSAASHSYGRNPVGAPTGEAGAKASGLTLAFTGDVALNWRGTPTHWKRFPWSANPLRVLAPTLRAADFAVANMEGVLMRRDPKYAEERLNLWAPAASAQVFAPAGIDLVSTANNHAFDGRDLGVLETLRHLRETGVAVMGTGPTEKDARRPFVWRRPDGCIAFVPATTKVNKGVRGRARVAWYPRKRHGELLAQVRRARSRCAFVVVYIHWGREKAHFPSRRIRQLAHALVDAGAQLVVGHHPHVLQGVERRGGGTIVYSLGNFVFSNPNPETRRTALLWVTLAPRTPYALRRVELIPVFIRRRARYTPYPATFSQQRDLLRRLQSYSRPFGTQLVLRDGRIRVLGTREVAPPDLAPSHGKRP